MHGRPIGSPMFASPSEFPSMSAALVVLALVTACASGGASSPTVVDAGLHVTATTDTPWIYPDFELTDDIGHPIDQIAGGMDGRGRANDVTPEWVLDKLLTAEQGLAAVTTDAAYALGDEAIRGHLGPGTYADITILDSDVISGTPDDIRATEVIATIDGGEGSFCADPGYCPSGKALAISSAAWRC